MKITTKKIKDYISSQSNFTEVATPAIWKFFKKSDYLVYILEANSFNDVNYYCDEFMIKCRHLNLF
jgi:hypothetical protein